MTLEEFKKHNTEHTPDLTDEEYLEVKNKLEELADVFFDLWLAEINSSKKRCYDE